MNTHQTPKPRRTRGLASLAVVGSLVVSVVLAGCSAASVEAVATTAERRVRAER
mgnify:CR=1 FL=1